jgi:hypothetical protein
MLCKCCVRKKFLKNYLDGSKAFFISSKEHLRRALLVLKSLPQVPNLSGPKTSVGSQLSAWVQTSLERYGGNEIDTRGKRALRQLETQSKCLDKRSANSHHDAGEGASSGVKRLLGHGSAQQSERPFQVSSDPCSTAGLASGGGKRADSRLEDDVVSKKSRLKHVGGEGGGGDGGQGTGGGCPASLDSTQQTFPYDIFISHTWDEDDEGRDNHARVKHLNAGLRRLDLKTWFHDEQMQGNILNRMARGISGSPVVLICVTRRYMEKVAEEKDNNCKLQLEFALQCRQSSFMLPVVMEESMTDKKKWDGSLGLMLGCHWYHKLTRDADNEFEKVVSEIAVAVRKKTTLPNLQHHILVTCSSI